MLRRELRCVGSTPVLRSILKPWALLIAPLALDYGQPGLTERFDAITARSAPVIGIGVNDSAAFAPFTKTVSDQRTAVIAATEVLDANLIAGWTATPTHAGVASPKRVDRLLGAVREARRSADTVVLFLHWGTELSHCPNAAQRELATGTDRRRLPAGPRATGGGSRSARSLDELSGVCQVGRRPLRRMT